MTLTFDRDIEVTYGAVDQLSPLIRRVVANNPSPFTFLGTGTYILGRGEVAVIDPGPLDDAHLGALLGALEGETVTHILITHTHADHSPGARLLAERTGAVTYGFGPHPEGDRADVVADVEATSGEADVVADVAADVVVAGAGQSEQREQREPFDADFTPDVVTVHGDEIHGSGWSVEAVHTPGHLANHLCFALNSERTLFSGDHVMAWSTSVISPPGGDLVAYLASCDLLLKRNDDHYWPTHGPSVRDPRTYVAALMAHRRERTAQIIALLRQHPHTVAEIVALLYIGLNEKLVKAAGRSVLAHLEALAAQGDAVVDSGVWFLGHHANSV
jgi:glyoxylase-like metal-dependent hydrolase (beta-lactamase superfamily II)